MVEKLSNRLEENLTIEQLRELLNNIYHTMDSKVLSDRMKVRNIERIIYSDVNHSKYLMPCITHKNIKPTNSEKSEYYCSDCGEFVNADGTLYHGEWY